MKYGLWVGGCSISIEGEGKDTQYGIQGDVFQQHLLVDAVSTITVVCHSARMQKDGIVANVQCDASALHRFQFIPRPACKEWSQKPLYHMQSRMSHPCMSAVRPN